MLVLDGSRYLGKGVGRNVNRVLGRSSASGWDGWSMESIF